MSKKLMIVYGLLVMFLFYSLFITYVILAEPPRLSLEDALIWGWIWALAFGYCTYGTLKLYRQFREGNLKRITYSPATKRLITICQVAGSIVWAYLLLCLINTTDTALSPWHIWVPLAVGFVLVGIVMGAMYRDRKRQRRKTPGVSRPDTRFCSAAFSRWCFGIRPGRRPFSIRIFPIRCASWGPGAWSV